ncbi:MAG: hypothetical protein NZ951_05435 [Dehalococcoidia bacterium]|nr:hypothetical protein [Dehalococcoidia bacterium]MDW8120214.1 hypothetical protein [Chloroflexota bacterium]
MLRVLAMAVVTALVLLGGSTVFAQPQVMRFAGTVVLDGRPAPEGTRVVAEVQVGGTWREAASTTVYGGSYTLTIGLAPGDSFPTGAPIRFRVGTLTADQTATWEPGSLRSGFNLTAFPPPPPPQEAWRGLQRALQRAWSYEDPRNPRFFDFGNPGGSTLQQLERNRAYFLFLTEDTTLECRGVTYTLRRGWNLFAWTC